MKVSFYGCPGSGKSTLALGLTHYLKSQGEDAEYVSEYIKHEIATHGCVDSIFNQIKIVTEQNNILKSYFLNTDYVITDSGLLSSLVYLQLSQDSQSVFAISEIYNLTKKLNAWFQPQYNILVLPRESSEGYKDSLRNQNHEESIRLDGNFRLLMNYDLIIRDGFTPEYTFEEIFNKVKKKK